MNLDDSQIDPSFKEDKLKGTMLAAALAAYTNLVKEPDGDPLPLIFVERSADNFPDVVMSGLGVTDELSKMLLAEMAVQVATGTGAIRVGISYPTWMAEVNKNTPPEIAKMQPRDRPDKVDAWMMEIVSPEGIIGSRLRIVRFPDKPPDAGDVTVFMKVDSKISGRIFARLFGKDTPGMEETFANLDKDLADE